MKQNENGATNIPPIRPKPKEFFFLTKLHIIIPR